MRGLTTMVTLMLFTVAAPARAQGVQVSGGVDARATNQDAENPNEVDAEGHLRVQSALLNLRKVWSDNLGDRWIGVAQADFDDNFQRVRPYQVYLQYKGPLGKWNMRAGHYLLPFGLLATYDTERLVFQGIERTSLAIRKDTGVEVFGRVGAWDYAVSVTDGLSEVRFVDSRANPVLTARWAYVRDTLQVGVSTLAGRVLSDSESGTSSALRHERRVAGDMTESFGRWTIRAEGVVGTDEGKAVGGGVLPADYALLPRLELNTRYADWRSEDGDRSAGWGVTYQAGRGIFVRAAHQHHFQGERANAFTVQLYYEFSRQF